MWDFHHSMLTFLQALAFLVKGAQKMAKVLAAVKMALGVYRTIVTLMQLKQTEMYLRNDINPKHWSKNLTKFWVVSQISNQRALEGETIFFLAVPMLGLTPPPHPCWISDAVGILGNPLRHCAFPYSSREPNCWLLFIPHISSSSQLSLPDTISPDFETTALLPGSRWPLSSHPGFVTDRNELFLVLSLSHKTPSLLQLCGWDSACLLKTNF